MSDQQAALTILALALAVCLGAVILDVVQRLGRRAGDRAFDRHANEAVAITQPQPLMRWTPSGAPIGDAVAREFAARGERVEA
jgi:hypothetical protein